MNPSSESKDTASEADFAEIEKLRKRMVALMHRMDRVLIPLKAMQSGIMPGEPDYPKLNDVSDVSEDTDFDEELAIKYDEPQYAEPKEH